MGVAGGLGGWTRDGGRIQVAMYGVRRLLSMRHDEGMDRIDSVKDSSVSQRVALHAHPPIIRRGTGFDSRLPRSRGELGPSGPRWMPGVRGLHCGSGGPRGDQALVR